MIAGAVVASCYRVRPTAFVISIVLNLLSKIPGLESLRRSEGVPSVFEKSSKRTPMIIPMTISVPIIASLPFLQSVQMYVEYLVMIRLPDVESMTPANSLRSCI